MKTRVLLLSQEVHPIPPTKGAAVEQWIDAVAHRLYEFEPHIASVPHPTRPDSETDGGVTYQRIRIGRVYNRLFRKLSRIDPYPYIARVADYARAISPRIVHLHNAPQFVGPLQELLPSARLILHMHNEKQFGSTNKVACLAGCSQYVTDWYRKRGFPTDRFAVLPNGVDVSRFCPSVVDTALRRKHGIPEDAFVVLYVGRISPEKGVDRLVDAMSTTAGTGSHLVLVGEWPKGDASRSKRVRYAESLRGGLARVPSTVIDVVSPTEMHRYYHLGDIVVIPSQFEEPFSMVAIEAMASGVPVLAARRGGMVEYLRHGENSLLFEADAMPEEIARSIQSARADPSTRSRIALAARTFVAANFGWQRVADQTASLYRQVMTDSHE